MSFARKLGEHTLCIGFIVRLSVDFAVENNYRITADNKRIGMFLCDMRSLFHGEKFRALLGRYLLGQGFVHIGRDTFKFVKNARKKFFSSR